MSDRTYTVAGTSVQNGKKTLRLANGTAAARSKILIKAGCTEVKLFDLPQPMSAPAAQAWLLSQGDSVPASVPSSNTAKQRKTADLADASASTEPVEIAHEELGFAASGMTREYWDNQSVIVRQEMSRNAAWAAGIECARGTYPELDMWLEMEGIFTHNDGTLQEAA